MKVSHNWLKNLVEINCAPEDLSEKLSIGGFEVESLEDCSEMSSWNRGCHSTRVPKGKPSKKWGPSREI